MWKQIYMENQSYEDYCQILHMNYPQLKHMIKLILSVLDLVNFAFKKIRLDDLRGDYLKMIIEKYEIEKMDLRTNRSFCLRDLIKLFSRFKVII